MEKQKLDRRTKYSMNVIRQALFELLAEKPLEEITVVEICKIADVNRGTFYKYYRDVLDLYDKTEDALVNEFLSLLPDTQTSECNPHFFLKNALLIMAKNREFIYIVKDKPFSDRFAQKILVFFRPHIQQLIKTTHPTLSSLDIILFTEYVLGGCTKVVTYWLNHNMDIPIDEIEKTLYNMTQCTLS